MESRKSRRTRPRPARAVRAAGVCACALLAALMVGNDDPLRAQAASPTRPPAPPLAVINGLSDPEAVVFDPARDVYYVSNVNGTPGVKDGNGFISRVTADGTMDSLHFIQGGRNGVTLNAPMGARVHGDTLWVLDVDVLRGFSTRTGAQVAAVDFSPLQALFLNDLSLDPAGGFYITDTGVRMSADGKPGAPGPNRIYHVDRDHTITVALETPALALPDGIDWDAHARRYVLAPFGGKAVQEWHPGDPAPVDVAPGKGRFDGVEAEADGSLLVTSWNDSTVSVLEDHRLVHRVGPLTMSPADVSLDARRGRVGIVSLEANRFELRPWPRR